MHPLMVVRLSIDKRILNAADFLNLIQFALLPVFRNPHCDSGVGIHMLHRLCKIPAN